jgi:hypothetical protein
MKTLKLEVDGITFIFQLPANIGHMEFSLVIYNRLYLCTKWFPQQSVVDAMFLNFRESPEDVR